MRGQSGFICDNQKLQTVEYYSAVKRKELLMRGAPWMNLRNTMLSGSLHVVWFHLYEVSRKGKTVDSRSIRQWWDPETEGKAFHGLKAQVASGAWERDPLAVDCCLPVGSRSVCTQPSICWAGGWWWRVDLDLRCLGVVDRCLSLLIELAQRLTYPVVGFI